MLHPFHCSSLACTFCCFCADLQILLSQWLTCCYYVQCWYLFLKNIRMINFHLELCRPSVAEQWFSTTCLCEFWLRKLLPEWISWFGAMSRRHLGLDGRSADRGLFGSVPCRYVGVHLFHCLIFGTLKTIHTQNFQVTIARLAASPRQQTPALLGMYANFPLL